RGMKKEKDKKNRSNHTAASANTDATVTVLMTQVVDNTEEGSKEWLCDSGVSSHISQNSGDFQNLRPTSKRIVTADGRTHMATGLGDARVSVRLWDGLPHTVVLRNTLYVPS